ncbi:MAG: conserved repeat domain protein [Chthoniobacteraceae bacterium]|nr:conserved repeat domain protein [Chthoniobacteraceae bacterium]
MLRHLLTPRSGFALLSVLLLGATSVPGRAASPPAPQFRDPQVVAGFGAGAVKVVGSRVNAAQNPANLTVDKRSSISFTNSTTQDVVIADDANQQVVIKRGPVGTSALPDIDLPMPAELSAGHISDLAVADLNSDSLPDLVVVCGGRLVVYINSFDQNTTTNPTQVPSFAAPVIREGRDPDDGSLLSFSCVAAIQIDLQEAATTPPDIVAGVALGDPLDSSSRHGFLAHFHNDGHGTLGNAPEYLRMKRGVSFLATGDLNNDGFTDIVTGDAITGRVLVLKNMDNGGGTRTISPTISVPAELFALGGVAGLAIGDTDNDGARDILALTGQTGTSNGQPATLSYVTLFHNNGTGTMSSYGSLRLKTVSSDTPLTVRGNVAIGDLNGDGTTGEIVVADALDDQISILTVDPTLQALNHSFYALTTTLAAAKGARSVEIGDLDGDGVVDLFVANSDVDLPGEFYSNSAGSGGGGTASVNIEFAEAAETVTEGGTADVVLNRGTSTAGAFSVSFTVGGTATVNNGRNGKAADFSIDTSDPEVKFNPATKAGSISFTAAEQTKTIKVTIPASTGEEVNETVTFLLGTVTPFTQVLGEVTLNTLTITDTQKPSVKAPGKLIVVPSNVIKRSAADLRGFGVAAVGRNGSDWTFTVTQPSDPLSSGVKVKVQYSLSATTDSWTDLLDLQPLHGVVWSGKTSDMPEGQKVFFRTVSSANGLLDTNGRTTAAYAVVPGPKLQLTAKQAPKGDSSDPARFTTTTVTTYNSDEIHYSLVVKNAGDSDATNVILAIPLSYFVDAKNRPTSLKNHFLAGTQPNIAGASLQLLNKRGAVTSDPSEVFSAQYVYPTLKAGETDFVTVVLGTLSAAEYNARDQTASFNERIVWSGASLSAKDQGVISRAASPASLTAVVANPLDVLVSTTTSTDSNNIASTGGTIQYEFTITNHANFTFNEVKFKDTVPAGTALYGVNDQEGTSGNFTRLPINTASAPGGNPSVPLFQYGKQQEITWTLGSIPAHGTRTIRYTVKVQNDLATSFYDAAGVSHTTEINNGGYSLTATPPTGGTITNATGGPTRTLVTGFDPAAIPFFRFEKHAISEGANAGGEIRVQTTREPVDLPTVLPNDLVKYTLHIKNNGDVDALNGVVQDEIATGVQFAGFISIAGHDPFPNQLVARKADGSVLPSPIAAADLKLVKVLEFHVGAIAANQALDLTYKTQAIAPVGSIIVANDARMWTASLTMPVKCSPAVAPVMVVKPISFELETQADKSRVRAGETLTYTVTCRNNGGVPALNSAVVVPIPAGTTYVTNSGIFVADDHTPVTGGSVEAPSRANSALLFSAGDLPAGEHRNVQFKVTVNNPLLTSLKVPGSHIDLKPVAKGFYQSGAVARQFSTGRLAAPAMQLVTSLADAQQTPVLQGPTAAHLWAMKSYPNFVYSGQKLQYQLTWGNSGDDALPGIQAAIQIPFGTELVPADTTPGYALHGGIVSWRTGPLAGHGAGSAILVVKVLKTSVYKDDTLNENSAFVASTNAPANGVVPGVASTLILSESPLVGAWQSLGAVLRGIGANLFGNSNPQLDQSVKGLKGNAVSVTIRGADVITLNNGILLIPNQGGKLVASGAGNLIASGGGNLIASGGGNLVASGAGNIVVQGTGASMSFAGIGVCSPSNLTDFAVNQLVASGAGNLIASGGGNVISDNGLGVISNDGGSIIAISSHDAGLIASGGGNLVASGAGNLIASGGGNLVASGAGNFSESLLSSRAGVVTVVSGSGFVTVGRLISQDGGGLISQDGGGLISQDGGGLISQDGGGILSRNAGQLISQDGGGLKLTNGASLTQREGNQFNGSADRGLAPTSSQ